ncbi:MAG: hypothetical protein DME76_19465 [Verrucomicrobia bacterium]|nr:MAG: hypothetical protein DME76_19465 [Verrucomicrobiota bacterium]
MLGRDVLRHLDSCLLNPLRDCLAAGEKQCAQQQINSQQKLGGASHPFDGHLLCSFAPGAMATSVLMKLEIEFVMRDQLRSCCRSAKVPDTMIEVEVRARGLRNIGKDPAAGQSR